MQAWLHVLSNVRIEFGQVSTLQLSSAAVSWRASWSSWSPRGATQRASCAEQAAPTFVLLSVMPQTVTGRNAPVMSFELAFFGFASACVPQKPGVRHTTGVVVLVVLLVDVD